MACTTILGYILTLNLSNQNVFFLRTVSVAIRTLLFHSVRVLAIVSVCYTDIYIFFIIEIMTEKIWNLAGQKFAMLELKVVLANLLRRFKFSLRDPTEPKIECLMEITIKPKTNVNLIVLKRDLRVLWNFLTIWLKIQLVIDNLRFSY